MTKRQARKLYAQIVKQAKKDKMRPVVSIELDIACEWRNNPYSRTKV